MSIEVLRQLENEIIESSQLHILHTNIGATLERLGRLDEALISYNSHQKMLKQVLYLLKLKSIIYLIMYVDL